MKTGVSVVRPEPVVTVLRASVGWTCGSMNWKSDQVLGHTGRRGRIEYAMRPSVQNRGGTIRLVREGVNDLSAHPQMLVGTDRYGPEMPKRPASQARGALQVHLFVIWRRLLRVTGNA
jgi:hypothetical protein